MQTLTRLACLIAFGALLAACNLSSIISCTDELGMRPEPGAATLSVGQSVSVRVKLTTCGGAKSVSDVITWTADDTAVVRVDGQVGRVTGRSPGVTYVMGTGERYGSVAWIPVTVK